MSAPRAGWLFILVSLPVVGFHLALVAGAPWGGLTMAGRWPGVLPVEGRAVSAVSVLMMAAFMRAVAERAGLARRVFPGWSIFVVLACLALGALANALTPVAAERALWLPLIVVELACALRVLRG